MLFGRKASVSSGQSISGSDVVAEDVHNAENPYCSKLNCSCHTDVSYHAQVQQGLEATEEEVEVTYSFFGIRRR